MALMSLWDPENLEALRVKTAERLRWTAIEYSRQGHLVGHGPGRRDLKVVPSYSRDVSAAWEVVEGLNKQGWRVAITNPRAGIPEYTVEITRPDGQKAMATHERIAVAICTAFVALEKDQAASALK